MLACTKSRTVILYLLALLAPQAHTLAVADPVSLRSPSSLLAHQGEAGDGEGAGSSPRVRVLAAAVPGQRPGHSQSRPLSANDALPRADTVRVQRPAHPAPHVDVAPIVRMAGRSVPAVFFFGPHKTGTVLVTAVLGRIAAARNMCHFRTSQFSRYAATMGKGNGSEAGCRVPVDSYLLVQIQRGGR